MRSRPNTWGESHGGNFRDGMNVRESAVLYSRGVGVRAWCDGARGRRLQHLGGAHHHVKLTWILRDKRRKKSGCPQLMIELQIAVFFKLIRNMIRVKGRQKKLISY